VKESRNKSCAFYNDIRWEIYGILIICIGVLGLVSLYTDSVGSLGIILKKNIKGLAGAGALTIPLGICMWGFYCLLRKKFPRFTPKLYGILLVIFVVLVVLHIKPYIEMKNLSFIEKMRKSADLGENGIGGGLIGGISALILFTLFGSAGTYVLLFAFISIGIILSTGVSISETIKHLINAKKEKRRELKPHIINSAAATSGETEEKLDENERIKEKENLFITSQSNPEKTESVIERNKTCETSDNTFCVDQHHKNQEYNFPPVNLLQKSSSKQNNLNEKELLNNAQILENTLESFGIQAKVVQVSFGPVVTRYEVQPSPGIKVSRIVNLADDIALSLAVPDVRIEAPIPGKAAIGIEVPNKEVLKVYFREIIESAEFKNSSSKLTVALGKDIAGKPVVADLAEMPHLLIAGATGSGKSVCINTIITSILYKASPNEVKLLLIDPKVVELTTYNGIPHLIAPVVTDAKKAASALNWMVSEMERRYKLFAKEGVREINRFNEVSQEKLPKVLVIIDELADLMMVSPREVEESICRLAQMARAAGIHLVVATQRPSVDVITGLIKANIPSRISFAVSSQVDSRTILDMAGAEKLLGKGDMLFFPVGAAKPMRIQGAFLSEKEVEKVVAFVKNQMEPSYEKDLSDFEDEKSLKNEDDVDELFKEALSVVIENGQASASLLQRKLRIGYARAARLIDQMEEKGFIGKYEGSKPRQILITKEQFEKYFNESA
jgi:S-DNA-T family DNA segregation ATPase FtsK/SpoIIIE